MAAATNGKIIAKTAVPTIAHLFLPPNTMGIGPKNITPDERYPVSSPSSLGLKLRRSMIVPRPVIARPNQRVGADKLIAVLPPRESAMS